MLLSLRATIKAVENLREIFDADGPFFLVELRPSDVGVPEASIHDEKMSSLMDCSSGLVQGSRCISRFHYDCC